MYWYSRHLYSITWWDPSAKVCCVPSFVYWYSRHLCSIHGGPLAKGRFVCQFWCTGIHSISALFPGGPSAKVVCLPSFVYWYSGHLCSIHGGPSAKVGSSANLVYWYSRHLCSIHGGSISQKKVCLPNLSSQMFRCGHHRGLFVLHTKDQ